MIAAETENGTRINVPRRFGSYIATRLIGSGSTCVVFEAQDELSGELFAVKVISRSDMMKRGLIKKIEREINEIKRLDHENVVKCIETIMDGDLIFVVMEHCSGGDLLTWIMDGKFQSDDHIKMIFKQVLNGVRYLHSIGIAHGDIKPENVMMTASGVAKLTDFGYCHTSRTAGNDEKSGTLFYAAPELFYDGYFDTYKTDVWALGIMLFSMMTGQFPYEDGDDRYTVQQIIKGKILWTHDMDAATKRVIQSMVELNASHRPEVEELLNDEYFTDVEAGNENVKAAKNTSDELLADDDMYILTPAVLDEMTQSVL